MGPNLDWRGAKSIFVLIKNQDSSFGFVVYETLVEHVRHSLMNVREYDLIKEDLGNHNVKCFECQFR